MFNMFEELFAPGRKHTRDEQKRLELTREDVGDQDPGRGPIDLSSGKVVVRRPAARRTAREDRGEDQDPPEGPSEGLSEGPPEGPSEGLSEGP
ncbi:DUF6191 domain-containing protein [Streptomyces sp. NPDC020996]|uniref:DUF6191 domain-containing protein n=1 Tax=Streptomyces sp. NPDC020996 TaxID=3154791 RepID=UPI003408DB07